MEIYTIGHSNVAVEQLVAALRAHGITLVVDTRTSPYSRYVPWANREPLAAALAKADIGYHFAGAELGGKPTDPTLRTPEGAPDYDKIAQSAPYRRGLEELIALASRERVALLCSEADPFECHRERLIGRSLRGLGHTVKHVQSDGTLVEAVQGTLF